MLCFAAAPTVVPLFAGVLGFSSAARDRPPLNELPLGRAISDSSRHRGYWLRNAGFQVRGFYVTFIATHLPAYLVDQGLSARNAAYATKPVHMSP